MLFASSRMRSFPAERAPFLRGFAREFSVNGILFAVIALVGAACLTAGISEKVVLPAVAFLGLIVPTVRRVLFRSSENTVQRPTIQTSITPADVQVQAHLLFISALAKVKSGDLSGERTHYSALIGLANAPRHLVALAFYNRAIAAVESGDPGSAMSDYSEVITLADAPTRIVAMALYNRGILHAQSGDYVAEHADYSRVISMQSVENAILADALNNRGVARGEKGDYERSISDFTAAISVLNGTMIGQSAYAYFNRGATKAARGDHSGAIADYSFLISAAGAPRPLFAMALYNRSFAFRAIGDTRGAIRDLETLISTYDAPEHLVASARAILADPTTFTTKAWVLVAG